MNVPHNQLVSKVNTLKNTKSMSAVADTDASQLSAPRSTATPQSHVVLIMKNFHSSQSMTVAAITNAHATRTCVFHSENAHVQRVTLPLSLTHLPAAQSKSVFQFIQLQNTPLRPELLHTLYQSTLIQLIP